MILLRRIQASISWLAIASRCIIPAIHGLEIKCLLRSRLISCAHGIMSAKGRVNNPAASNGASSL